MEAFRGNRPFLLYCVATGNMIHCGYLLLPNKSLVYNTKVPGYGLTGQLCIA